MIAIYQVTEVNPDCGGSTGTVPDVAWEIKKHPEQSGPRQSCGEGIPNVTILKYLGKASGIPFPETLIQVSHIRGGQ